MSEQKWHVSVRMLGDFAVLVDGSIVSEPLRHSKKLLGVAQYLLLHLDRSVPHTELYETFWPGESSVNPRAALKTLMHRLRAALVQGGAPADLPFVLVKQGGYQWNSELGTQVDVTAFEKKCQQAQDATLGRDEQIRVMNETIALYRGRFLDDSALWMLSPAAYLHGCYLKTVGDICALLREDGHFDEIVTVCRGALQFDEMDESLNYACIEALAAAGRTQEAMTQYQRVTELYYNTLGVQISEELRTLYRTIAEAEQTLDLDIDSVRDKLQERQSDSGAYVCEYGIFQDIYRIEERCLARYGGRIFLGLLTVTNAYCEMPELRVLNKSMERLLGITCACLRSCDVVARYSPAQYVILLPTVTYETGTMVLERIRKAFRAENPRSSVVISCKLRPLRPAEDEAPAI